MPWGLSDAEIGAILGAEDNDLDETKNYPFEGGIVGTSPLYNNVVQATLRHVYEEGEKLCPHLNDDEYGPQVLEKWKCFTCRAELAKEAGL